MPHVHAVLSLDDKTAHHYDVDLHREAYILLHTVLFYHHLYCYSTVLYFIANITLLLWLNDEFDGIWTSWGLQHRFRCDYDGFGFYDHLDIMIKMVWSQGGHIKQHLL